MLGRLISMFKRTPQPQEERDEEHERLLRQALLRMEILDMQAELILQRAGKKGQS